MTCQPAPRKNGKCHRMNPAIPSEILGYVLLRQRTAKTNLFFVASQQTLGGATPPAAIWQSRRAESHGGTNHIGPGDSDLPDEAHVELGRYFVGGCNDCAHASSNGLRLRVTVTLLSLESLWITTDADADNAAAWVMRDRGGRATQSCRRGSPLLLLLLTCATAHQIPVLSGLFFWPRIISRSGP